MLTRATHNTLHGRARFQPLGDVIGWQEVDTPAGVRRLKALPGYSHFIPDSPDAGLRAIPISWLADRFTLIDAGVRKAHDGRKGVTLARGVSWVVLLDGATGMTSGHLNSHFVRLHGVVPAPAWRRESWAAALKLLNEVATTLQLQHGDVTIGLDANRRKPIRLPHFINAGTGSIDQLLATRDAAQVVKGPRFGSDHAAWVATYETSTGGDVPRNSPVRARGTDSSGRTIWASDYLWSWWEGLVFDLGFRPTVVQGSWQSKNGGGAVDSAGYHDLGGALDIRTRDLTRTQIDAVVRLGRLNGGDAWERRPDLPGGMDPHIHIGLHTDTPTHPGIQAQHRDYLANGNGLSGSSHAPDHHPRPNPLVTFPPKEAFMPTVQEIWDHKIPLTDGSGKELPAKTVLAMAQNRAGDARKIAAALKKEGVTANLDEDAVEDALRKVLGSLDNDQEVTP